MASVGMTTLIQEFCGGCAVTMRQIHRASDAITIGSIPGGGFFSGARPEDFAVLADFIDYAKSEFALSRVARRDMRRDDVEADAQGERLVLSGEPV